ncbi:MAG: hypothetical protein JWN40_697 [Phycisphaerales bacterium]|nr:hypothetical protein [Phycisphaerales bacterium]
MARRGASLDELFDRPYRPGAAFGARISPLRRWGMVFVFCLLVSVICTYWILTDSRRVRTMAQDYLSKLTGGHVEVQNATLSIFEGLRLDGVVVRVDDPDNKRPDSVLFKAETILIKYNPQSILSGRLEATQIVALDPQVFLCEDLNLGRWNWQRATREQKTTTRVTPGPPMKFPEILLRNAQLNYSRMRNGRVLQERGLIEIEGSLTPGAEGNFTFRVQSRSEADSIGPVVEGVFNVNTKFVDAKLRDFRFGKDIEVMLPEQVRTWWNEHGLSGNLDIPRFYMKPAGKDGQGGRFRIETNLKDVNLDIKPQEWLSRDELNRLTAMQQSMAAMKSLGLDSSGFVSNLETAFNPSKLELDQVAGRFVFTEEGIDIERVNGRIENTPFQIKGHIAGYSAQAAATLTFAGEHVTIPKTPRYLNSTPPEFREIYDHLQPEGDGALWVKIDRPTPGAKPVVMGRIDIADGRIKFDEFPYPLERIRGAITFGWDPKSQMDRVDVEMHGMGASNGPNKNVPVTVTGFVGPLGHGDSEFDFWVKTSGVTSEPALHNAYPAPVREALKIFDAPGKGEFPQYHGGFVANVHRPFGFRQKWAIAVDVDLDDARGALTFFPYPVEHLKAKLHVTEDHVDLKSVSVVKGDASFGIDGIVRFGKDQPIEPELHLTAQNIPIDRDLLAALPKDRREWMTKLGVGGKIDVEGRIVRDVKAPRQSAGARKAEDDISYDMQLKLKDGSFWPADGTLAASSVTGTMRLTPTALDVSDIRGRRGLAEISGSGKVAWPVGRPSIVINAAARSLHLDAGLYKMLPPAWRTGWDQAKPEGSIDLDMHYSGGFDSTPVAVASAADAAVPAPADRFEASIRPVKLSMTPRVIPVRLDNVKGEILIRPDLITLKDITATRRSGGTIAYSGTVPTGSDKRGGAWDLKLSAKDLASDKELRAGLPPAVAKLMESLKAQGKFSADFTKLTYRADPDPAVDDGELDLAGTITLNDNSFDLGVPVSGAVGTVTLEASARHGKLAGLTGNVELSSMTLGGRAITNFKCDLTKPDGADALRIGKVSGDIAGGALAGQVDLVFPDKGASRFGLGLVLRNANVAELAGPTEKDIKGQLTASLAIEGDWGDPSTRRGRGDVSVTGKDMYRIPLVLGLMQITNLSLPISSPFNEAAVRYSVEGEKVSFEQIELRASNMLMSGSGWLDFKSKRVRMTFVTDSPNAWRIPFITEIIRGARQELMQIHVSGTVKEPKVSGSMMNTFTTTVDEVFDKSGTRKGGK